MNAMKKIFAILLVGIMIFALASCDPKNKEEETTTKAPEETTTKAPEETTTKPIIDLPTDDPTNEPEDTTVSYTVTVVDKNNAPLAGAVVQLCVGDLCRLPVLTDANGVATLNVDEDNYTVKVTLTGYTGEASYSFPAGSTALTVQLTKIAGDDNNGGNVGGDNGDNGDNGNNNDNTGDNNNNNNNNNDNTGDNNNNNNNSTGGELEMPEIPI